MNKNANVNAMLNNSSDFELLSKLTLVTLQINQQRKENIGSNNTFTLRYLQKEIELPI